MQWQAPRAALGGDARNRRAKTRMALDQLQGTLNLSEEFSAKSGAFLFVPSDGRAELESSRLLDAKGFAHLRRMSASI